MQACLVSGHTGGQDSGSGTAAKMMQVEERPGEDHEEARYIMGESERRMLCGGQAKPAGSV